MFIYWTSTDFESLPYPAFEKAQRLALTFWIFGYFISKFAKICTKPHVIGSSASKTFLFKLFFKQYCTGRRMQSCWILTQRFGCRLEATTYIHSKSVIVSVILLLYIRHYYCVTDILDTIWAKIVFVPQMEIDPEEPHSLIGMSPGWLSSSSSFDKLSYFISQKFYSRKMYRLHYIMSAVVMVLQGLLLELEILRCKEYSIPA